MKFGPAITLSVLLSCALCVTQIGAQPAPGEPCESCDSPPCGCAGHSAGCCCNGLCRQAPPNPLAPGRPSPPPCCADGYCYPNYDFWGHYPTRWRRWPIELAATIPPGAQPPPAARPDVPPFDPLPPEEEDRRAPPPSVPRGKPVEIGPRRTDEQEEAEESPRTRPTTPSPPTAPIPPQERESVGTGLTPDEIFGLPPEGTPPTTTPPLETPIEETPGTTPLTPPDGGETPAAEPLEDPMGDQDLPPALPFAAPKSSKQPVGSSTRNQPANAAPKRDARTAPQDDPPPALPAALASALR